MEWFTGRETDALASLRLAKERYLRASRAPLSDLHVSVSSMAIGDLMMTSHSVFIGVSDGIKEQFRDAERIFERRGWKDREAARWHCGIAESLFFRKAPPGVPRRD